VRDGAEAGFARSKELIEAAGEREKLVQELAIFDASEPYCTSVEARQGERIVFYDQITRHDHLQRFCKEMRRSMTNCADDTSVG
jgi:hypothetical protein